MEDIQLFLPINMADLKKSLSGNEKGNYVRGWASTPDLDRQEDIIDPKGIDATQLFQHGYVNYEHDSSKIVGYPTANSYVDVNNGLFVETKLDMDSPYAREMWDKAQSIAKSGSSERLGYSVEGKVLRDPNNPRVISKAIITGLALTIDPANPNATWEALVKSMTTGYGVSPDERESAGALRIQDMKHKLHNLSISLKDFTKDDFKEVAKLLDKEERFSPHTAVLMLQLAHGCSRKEALDTVLKTMKFD